MLEYFHTQANWFHPELTFSHFSEHNYILHTNIIIHYHTMNICADIF